MEHNYKRRYRLQTHNLIIDLKNWKEYIPMMNHIDEVVNKELTTLSENNKDIVRVSPPKKISERINSENVDYRYSVFIVYKDYDYEV